jgi:Domain of unknown function (DUF4926)
MFRLLDTVALMHDISTEGLRMGDRGAIVEIYSEDAYEVEFIDGSGRTRALLTLTKKDIRPLDEIDPISVRSSANSTG